MKRIIPEDIKDFVEYNPETGTFVWTQDRGYNKVKGKEILNVDANGYNIVVFKGKNYKAHRVAFYLMGEEVPEFVDHISGNRSDNRWANLRPATKSQNAVNSKAREGASQKSRGVDFNKQQGKFRARITEGQKTKLIGYFPTEELAYSAYKAEAQKVFGEFVRPAPCLEE